MKHVVKYLQQLDALMRSLILMTFLLVCVPSHAQSTDDLKNKEAIALNKVHTRVSWDYQYSGEKPGKTGVKTSITTFTDKGDISQVDALNPKGTVTHSEKYRYDARGNKTEYTRTSGESSYQKKYVYNNKNQLTEESGFDGIENFRNLYNYNAQGEMTEIRYMKKSVLFEKRVFEKKDATTTVSVFNTAGVLTSKLLLKYDTRGNLIEEIVYGGNQSELEKKTYHYDDNKNLKEEAKYKLDRITLKTSYNYDPSGAMTEITEETPGVARFVKKSFTYDPKGSLLEIKWRRKGTEEFNRITYQYDDRGLCTSADTYYPATHYRVLTRYTYAYF
jgi:hypothetical protein